ncbi:hypothetical protein L228DRAFT_230660 [Xylona heveae TC161]|uniref:Uncharacterized protein n=1 Tax=Xylona heveae (strain CBS 132557 / TC161) TaxID=1328760 RepID=A0A165GJZ4_XYLHT|nr:hypothetical protein L228DRAFT_230660 [Xylona heveae TC161]KZF22285.1 hypothetical protein L228DRAFT_230660 [Xylona heveae TC161]
MAKQEPFYLYKETRLNLEPASLKSIAAIRLPAHGVSNQAARGSTRRAPVSLTPIEDENAFSRRVLASSASAYWRKDSQSHPRGYLWRVLDESKTLEIQTADLTRSEKTKHIANGVLRLSFPNAIRPGCVAMADLEGHELVSLFALTTSNDLYTLTLRPEFFRHSSAVLDSNVGDWCKTFLPSSFSFRYPHRLVAKSPHELLVSLHDGGLLTFVRRPGDDGSSWRETFFTEGGWGSSLRSLIPWKGHNTVRFGNVDLEQTTATSMSFSPDKTRVFTICLNHTLKLWNLSTGEVEAVKDLLNEERQPQDIPKYLIDPAHTQLLQVFNAEGAREGDLYYVMTYSPYEPGHFKFWAIRETDEDHLAVEDLFPGATFTPPEPYSDQSEIWSLSYFRLKSTGTKKGLELWIVWSNNLTYRVQRLLFDLLDLPTAWSRLWMGVASETLLQLEKPTSLDMDPADATDKWLQFFFSPPRFTEATLETALSLYIQNLSADQLAMVKKGKSLKERLCLAIGSSVALDRNDEGDLDYEHFRANTFMQWDKFYYLTVDLDKRRREAVSFVYDEHDSIPWILTADGVSLIRECSDMELLFHNRRTMGQYQQKMHEAFTRRSAIGTWQKQPSEVSGFIAAARLFRQLFSPSLLHSCLSVLSSEMLQDPSVSAAVRVQSFYDRCNFASQIGDEDYSRLADALDYIGGFKALDNEVFRLVISTASQRQLPVSHHLELGSIGIKNLLAAAQETINLTFTVLFDLLVLIVFIEGEIDKEEHALEELDTTGLYVEILRTLKKYSLLSWLATTMCTDSGQDESDQNFGAEKSSEMSEVAGYQSDHRTVTVLEELFIGMWKVPTRDNVPGTALTTYSARCWISNLMFTEGYEDVATRIMCKFLHRGDIHIASDFMRFMPDTPWATYLKGRLHLARSEHSMASLSFKKAGFGLARGKHTGIGLAESEGLLNVADLSYFHDGLAKYYMHILSLFEKARANSYVADFARLAIQFTSFSKSQVPQQRTEILSRLFYASIQTSRFEEAYSALARYTDTALQKSALTTLITSMIAQSRIPQLLRLPFTDLQPQVDAILSSLCQKTLNIATGPPYHQILYAYRLSRNDFRGAATIMHERLQRLRTSSSTHSEVQNEAVAQTFLTLINLLSSVDPKHAWILAEPSVNVNMGRSGVAKRKIVTLSDVRKEYQQELDRVAAIDSGNFPFAPPIEDDEMDVF